MVRKTVISQLQSVGEGALGKLAQSPATRGAVQGAMQVKERSERIFHSLDSIDDRLRAIERRLSALEKSTKDGTAPSRARSGAAGTRSGRTTEPGAGSGGAGAGARPTTGKA